MTIAIPANDELEFTLQQYQPPDNQNCNFTLEDTIFTTPPDTPEFQDPGIGNLANLPLAQKIMAVAYNPVFLLLLFGSFTGGVAVKSTRNAWVGITVIDFVVLSGFLIGFIPLGVLFITLLMSVATGLVIRGVDRKDTFNVNVDSFNQ